MKKRIAIVEGVRTPMAKAGGRLASLQADELGAYAVTELLARAEFPPQKVGELIFGNVAQPPHAANIARVIALTAGLPISTPAATVNRNCASGMEAITSGAAKILLGEAEAVIAGGTESMSNIPLLFDPGMADYLTGLARARSLPQRLAALLRYKARYLKPTFAITLGLTDPISGLIMGKTAEVLAREFHVTREEQDAYALVSHQRTVAAIGSGAMAEEIVPVPIGNGHREMVALDQGPRENQSLEALAKLPPYFERPNGTVTVGNSCPITDGAAAVLLMSEEHARALGRKPLGFLREFAYASLEPERMGLGPVYATAKLLAKAKMSMKDIQLVEMNEAFAAQIIANERAFASAEFARRYLGRDSAVGELPRERLNVEGGAIALGHPVGMTGTRLVIHLLKAMRRRGVQTGLATLCVGGGQGAALALEVE